VGYVQPGYLLVKGWEFRRFRKPAGTRRHYCGYHRGLTYRVRAVGRDCWGCGGGWL